MPCITPYRGDTSQLLLYKIASCLSEGGGGGGSGVSSFNLRTGAVTLLSADVTGALGFTPAVAGSGVTSFNTRTGAVTLTSGDVTTALGFTPISQATGDARYVLKAGDTMTGALNINTGSIAANGPALALTQTWNNAGVTFTGLSLNVTDTASTSESFLFDIQKDALSKFHVTNAGTARFLRQDQTNTAVQLFLRKTGNSVSSTGAIASGGGLGTLFFSGFNGTGNVQSASVQAIAAEAFTNLVNGTRLDFFTTPIGTNSAVVALSLLDTGAAAHTSGTAALPSVTFQSFPTTGLYSAGTNILGFSTAGTARWQISAAGHLLASTDATFDIGASGATRPKDLYLSNIANVGNALKVQSQLTLSSGGNDGTFLIRNNAGTDFGRLQFGGTTSSFPAIKRNAAALNFRLADDSADAAVTAAAGTFSGLLSTAAITMSVASKLSIASGTNQRAGNAVLVGGTITVNNTTVTANTIVILTRKTAGGTIGFAVTYTVAAATSFTITSDNALDTSTYSYLLIEVP